MTSTSYNIEIKTTADLAGIKAVIVTNTITLGGVPLSSWPSGGSTPANWSIVGITGGTITTY